MLKFKEMREFFIVDTSIPGAAFRTKYRYRILESSRHTVMFDKDTMLPMGFIMGFATLTEAEKIWERLSEKEIREEIERRA